MNDSDTQIYGRRLYQGPDHIAQAMDDNATRYMYLVTLEPYAKFLFRLGYFIRNGRF